MNSPEDISVKREKKPEVNVQSDLKNIAEDVISLLSGMDAVASQDLLMQRVSDLFYAQAQKRQREEHLVKQSEGIAAAKARGIQFDPRRKPLPENFEEYCEAWRDGQMSLREAAKACSMSHPNFKRKKTDRDSFTACNHEFESSPTIYITKDSIHMTKAEIVKAVFPRRP